MSTLGIIVLILVILFLVGALPSWPYSQQWGPGPSGGLFIVLIIVIVLIVAGKL